MTSQRSVLEHTRNVTQKCLVSLLMFKYTERDSENVREVADWG